ncbi:MAG: ATP-binding protein [Rickettsiaceae bacterium]|nr:ATP-binding protein [Rickettsiaceae bacterium]USN94511.1 MAG: ATP-binding protein [Candidatus Nomurabacteria bacterium]
MIHLYSFSYKKSARVEHDPESLQYIFDCRPILNPGRIPDLLPKNGKDKDVIEYLETKTKMPKFIESIKGIVEIAVEEYLEKKERYKELHIYFGCTGGQHRSVYCAEKIKSYIEEYFKLELLLTHKELKS